jgi:hypothetical protein
MEWRESLHHCSPDGAHSATSRARLPGLRKRNPGNGGNAWRQMGSYLPVFGTNRTPGRFSK